MTPSLVQVVDLAGALAELDQAYDPRIVGRYNDNKLVVARSRASSSGTPIPTPTTSSWCSGGRW